MVEQTNKEKKILGIALNEYITFTIKIENRTFKQKLFKIKERVYEVRRYTNLNQNMQITKLLLDIPEFVYEGKSDSELLQMDINFIAKHTDKFIDIIVILLGEKDRKFLINNLSNKDMLDICLEMFGMVDFESFTSTIALTASSASLKQNQ